MSTSNRAASGSRSGSSPLRPPSSSGNVFIHLSRHTLKQLKFVVPGGAVTYVLGTLARFWHLVEEERGWPRCVFLFVTSLHPVVYSLPLTLQIVCTGVISMRATDDRTLPLHFACTMAQRLPTKRTCMEAPQFFPTVSSPAFIILPLATITLADTSPCSILNGDSLESSRSSFP